MKILVFALIIVANVSNNGKASLDSFVPSTANILLPDTTKYADKSCYRPCKFNVKPRRCHYRFEISPTLYDDGRPALVINGMTPGPSIHVCANDIVVVTVKNNVPGQDIAIHWHGVEQKGTPYMDGVPMVTQCPISYEATYEYAFIASSPGTFFYHADEVSHHSDGIYGALIVDQPQPLEPHSSLYDYDRGEENTIIVGSRFAELLTASLEDLTNIRPNALVINGNENSTKLFVIPGYTYRLRLINAIALYCPLRFRIDGHDMTIIASDGKTVKPVSTSTVLLYPGERMDVAVRADQSIGGYWLRVEGVGVCENLSASAMLLYSGFNYTAMLQEGPTGIQREVSDNPEDLISGQKLQSFKDMSPVKNIRTVYLGIDRNIVRYKESENDFRYLSDAMPLKPFYPAALSENGVIQINRKNFLYPNAPYLLKPRAIRPDTICEVGKEMEYKGPQCVQVLKTQSKEVLELALVNEGFGSNDSYTFHLHGFSMQVVATWKNPDGVPLSREDFAKLDKNGKIKRNKRDPPIKDTVIVPNKGYTIVRIKPDHGGSWLLECKSCSLSSLPVAVLIDVPQSIPRVVIDSLPKCDNYKPADVLLN